MGFSIIAAVFVLTTTWHVAGSGPLHGDDPGPAEGGSIEARPPLHGALPRLKQLMLTGIERTHPNASSLRGAGETLFDGSYDWHSCVAAHWALLTIARTEEDRVLAMKLLERLTPAALLRELELLEREAPAGRGRITWPYDHAWFVMLCAELARHPGIDADGVRDVRLAAEALLFADLHELEFPERASGPTDGAQRYCGFYRSWLFAYWLLQLSDPISPAASEALERLRQERIEPEREALLTYDETHPFDFLWVPALLALIDRTAPGVDAERLGLSPYAPPQALAPLPDSVRISTVHVLGARLSRLWPCAVDAHAGDAEAGAAFEAVTRELLARTDLWEEDFAACSHWVPQYLFIGLWLADGRP